MKRKVFAALIVSVLVLGTVFTASASPTYGTVNPGVTWKLDGTVLVIGGEGEIWGYGIDSVDRPWQSYNDTITKVIIKSGITSIGPYTFYGMDSLGSFETGDTVTKLYENAIGNCPALCEVYFPETISGVEGKILENCPLVSLYVRPGGFGESFAQQNGFNYFYGGMLYAPDGETKIVADYMLESYLNSGLWYKDKGVAYVTMYSEDGRKTEVKITEVKAFESVGWHLIKFVQMYSLDGRTLNVAENEVELYKTVGWYATKEEVIYINAVAAYDTAMEEGNFKQAVNVTSDAIKELKSYPLGEPYIYWLTEKCTVAANKWSESIKCPLGYETSYTQATETGTGVVVTVRNLASTPIKGFKLVFNCYDENSKLVSTGSDFYYCNNITINPLEKKSFMWNFSGKNITSVRGIMIVQVDYEDGTVWKN